MLLLPFVAEIGTAIESGAPLIRRHFTQSVGTRSYSGIMRRVWRARGWRGRVAAPFLWAASQSNMLFPETGVDVPFELENTVAMGTDGRVRMIWMRAFRFSTCTRRFTAWMHYDPDRRVIVDLLGGSWPLEVELHARVQRGAMVVESGRQWRWLGPLRLPVPGWLRGNARVQEWQVSDEVYGIRVTIGNALLGDFFGYEGTFREVQESDSSAGGSHPATESADSGVFELVGTTVP